MHGQYVDALTFSIFFLSLTHNQSCVLSKWFTHCTMVLFDVLILSYYGWF